MATSTTTSNNNNTPAGASTQPIPLINYTSRDFNALKADLISYVLTYHSDSISYLNSSSPDMVYLELISFIGDGLNFQADKSFNEAFRVSAQSRESLIRIANDLGFYNYFPKPSSTGLILTINIPAIPNDDGSAMIPDPQYFFTINPGMSLQADNGTNFECLDEINFSDALNRNIIPNLDSNGKLIDFTVQKSISVFAGQTKYMRFYVSQTTAKPFMEIVIDDPEVTQIVGVIAVAGNTYDVPSAEDFRNSDNLYTEVENLSDDQIFVELNPVPQDVQNILNAYSDMSINYGEWINTPKRFVVRRDKDNTTSLIFGSTLVDYTTWNQIIGNYDASLLANFSLNQILNNKALGEVPPIDSTLFIKFRTGAGAKTDILTNSITNIVDKQISLPATPGNLTVFDQVTSSLKVISNLPAIGGTNAMSNEEIRNSVGKVFATNDRAVTYEDVKALINKLPAQFGQPFRISYEEIRPMLLSYTQLQNYVSTKLAELLLQPTTIDRQLKVQEINQYIAGYPGQIALINSQSGAQLGLAQVSDAFNSVANQTEHALWYGEKCRLYVLGINNDLQPVTIYKDSNGVWQSPNDELKLNIKNFLSTKRVIGDWIDIVDAKVVNLQISFKIIADKRNKQQTLVDCLTRLRNYFSPYNWQINQPIFISNVQTVLQEIEGVISVVSIDFYNIFGTDLTTGKTYSPVEIGRYKYLVPGATNNQNNRFKVQAFDNVISSFPDTFLSVLYPDIDIIGAVIN